MNKRELREAMQGITHANVAVRNFPMSAPELARRLKVKDGGECYLFGTTTATGRHIILATSPNFDGKLNHQNHQKSSKAIKLKY